MGFRSIFTFIRKRTQFRCLYSLQSGPQALPKIIESFPFGDKSIDEQITDLTSFSFHRPWHRRIYTFASSFFILRVLNFRWSQHSQSSSLALQQTGGNARISMFTLHTIPNGNLYSSREKSVPSPNMQGAEGLSGKQYMYVSSKSHSKGPNTKV